MCRVLLLSLIDCVLPKNMCDRLVGLLKEQDPGMVTSWIDRARTYVSGVILDGMMEAVKKSGVAVDDDLFPFMLLHDYRFGRYGDVAEAYEARFPQKTDLATGMIYLFALLRDSGLSERILDVIRIFHGVICDMERSRDVKDLMMVMSAKNLITAILAMLSDGISAERIDAIDVFS